MFHQSLQMKKFIVSLFDVYANCDMMQPFFNLCKKKKRVIIMNVTKTHQINWSTMLIFEIHLLSYHTNKYALSIILFGFKKPFSLDKFEKVVHYVVLNVPLGMIKKSMPHQWKMITNSFWDFSTCLNIKHCCVFSI